VDLNLFVFKSDWTHPRRVEIVIRRAGVCSSVRALKIVGVVVMTAGLALFVAGVLAVDRYFGLILALAGVGVMLGGVGLTSRAQASEVGPGQ
jgi:predicted phage tail protein